MADQSSLRQFILLPSHGLRATQPELQNFFSTLSVQSPADMAFGYQASGPQPVDIRVVDQVSEDGAKLVEMDPQSVANLRIHQPGIQIVPLVFFSPAVVPLPIPMSRPTAATALVSPKTTIKVISGKDGSPIVGAKVVWFSDFAHRVGDQGITDNQGEVSFWGSLATDVEKLYIYPQRNYWPLLKKNVTLKSNVQFELAPLDLAYTDCLRHFYGNAPDNAGQGVKVGVIDTGIANHNDLHIDGGENTVTGEPPKDFGDNGMGHGTHVAGMIAAHRTPPTGLRGVAPAVTLRSYRVFGQGSEQASNFAIAKAIDRAVTDGCHLINMSLGGGPSDPATRLAIEDAYSQGTLVIAAAGNEGHPPVDFPAAYSLCIAVAAMGRIGTFPANTPGEDYIASPHGEDPDSFFAGFSNYGPQVDLTGPGVEILSTFPGGYAALDGTSMATPAATGIAAKILAQAGTILSMPPDQTRADAMVKAILSQAKLLGFGAEFEGHGLLVI